MKFITSLITFVLSLGIVIAITVHVLNPGFPVENISSWTNMFIILFPVIFLSLKFMLDGYKDFNIKTSVKNYYVYIFLFCGLTGAIAAYFTCKIVIIPLISVCLIGIYITLRKDK